MLRVPTIGGRLHSCCSTCRYDAFPATGHQQLLYCAGHRDIEQFCIDRTDKVMPAWNDGVTGMQVGGKRLLLVPSRRGFGRKGVQELVPPESDLIFLFELVGLEKSETE